MSLELLCLTTPLYVLHYANISSELPRFKLQNHFVTANEKFSYIITNVRIYSLCDITFSRGTRTVRI